jgi:hypothetical protein
MTPIALDWHDMDANGMPAFQRALQAMVLAHNRLESQQNIALHQLEERLATLEYLMSEELMRELLPATGAQRAPLVVEMAQELAQLREDLRTLAAAQISADLPIGPLTEFGNRLSSGSRNGTSRDAKYTAGGEVWQKSQ